VKETKVETALTDGVEDRGGVCWKLAPISRVGIPDRLVLLPGGVIIFVETKAPLGVLKSWQARVHELLRRLGFQVEVLWNLEAVSAFLGEL
jgi:hypothetical protein